MLHPELLDIKEPQPSVMWAECVAASFHDQLAQGACIPQLDEELAESMPGRKAFEHLNDLGVVIKVRPGVGVILLSLMHDHD